MFGLAVTEVELVLLEGLLGRPPRGLEEVAVSDDQGHPRVIRVASLVEDKPFPTLFWLVDPELSYRIDREEAGGLIARMQRLVDSDEQLQTRLRADHLAHIELRDRYIDSGTRKRICELGFAEVLQARGIGGIADFTRIRCLHTWYAAHLVVPNTIGRLLDSHWQNYPLPES